MASPDGRPIFMAKDSYWFRHDSTAGRGTRLRKIQHIYKHEGKGLYWDVVEVLREQEWYKYESDTSSLNMLCDLIGCKDEALFSNWFNDCIRFDLLRKKGTFFYAPALSESMTVWDSKKQNGSKGGRGNKAKTKRNESETKANQKEVTEQNRTEQNKEEINRQFYLDSFSNQAWKENICIGNGKLITMKNFEWRMNSFMVQLNTDQKNHTSLSDFKKHFANWLRKQEPFGGSKLQFTING